MKNQIKNTKKGILMVTLMVASLSFANAKTSFDNTVVDAERTSVTFANVKEGDLLSIKDENGIVLYKESIQHAGIYTKGFDLTSLPDGKYLFELDKDVEITVIPFKVSTNKVEFDKDLEKTIFKPTTRVEGNFVFVSKLSLSEAPLKIKVYYGSDFNNYDLIHSETIENTKLIERVYKLDGLNNGTFKIVYQTEGRQFTEIIKN